MKDTVDILGVRIDRVNLTDAQNKVLDFLKEDKLHMIFTPNSEIIMAVQKDQHLMDVLNNADMLIADGIGVVYASKILGKPLPERVAGFDLASRLIPILANNHYSLYIFGGAPGVAEIAKAKLEEKNPGLRIVGVHDGYFDSQKEQEIINDINSKKPDVLFVCLGAPKQEKWIYEHREQLHVKVCMGIGGSVDVFAGKAKRAPEIYQKLGLEWFYRLMKEPWRYKRMLALPKFAWTVILERWRRQ